MKRHFLNRFYLLFVFIIIIIIIIIIITIIIIIIIFLLLFFLLPPPPLLPLHFSFFFFVPRPKKVLVAAFAMVVIAGAAAAAVVLRSPSHGHGGDDAVAAACRVYCGDGALMRAMQLTLFATNDSKLFVDQPLRVDPDEALRAFAALPANATSAQLAAFNEVYFAPAGSDLEPWVPPDHQSALPLLEALAAEPQLQNWTRALNDLWLVLGKRPTPDVCAHQQRNSLLCTRHPLIVPGGRFNESYYV